MSLPGVGTIPDAWEEEVRAYQEDAFKRELERKNMNLECRVPSRSPSKLLRAIDKDPVHDHYTPCELAPLLARRFISTFVTGTGIALLEITEEGYAFLYGESR